MFADVLMEQICYVAAVNSDLLSWQFVDDVWFLLL